MRARRPPPAAAGSGEGRTFDSRAHYWEWTSSEDGDNYGYLVPGVLRALRHLGGRRLLDIGCGNGALTARVAALGYEVTGIDAEVSGLEQARAAHPGVEFLRHDISCPLPEHLMGRFDVVLSAEVIEHLFLPRELFARAREALGDRGQIVVTTPYHGYLKNLAIALAGKYDRHWVPLSDFGHIKFFSEATLAELARQCGFEPVRWSRLGRLPPLAASMVMTGDLRASDVGSQLLQDPPEVL
jgi:2-polyprenyl-6-hydroxyphenyl methylase/3-demethylubiquinone-9 3-methyltransferase